jgi:uncharacterized phiE125 gp8 family phage protein
MALKCLSPSTALAVTVDDLKDHLRISSTDEDILLRSYIRTATKQAENVMKRQCCTAQWRFVLPEFKDEIELPRPPVVSSQVTIEYLNSSGGTATCPSTVYEVDIYQEPAVIRLNYESTWPETYGVDNSVRITFVAGYPVSTVDNEPTVPDDIKLWIMMRAGDMYEHRESMALGENVIPRTLPFVDGLLDPYIIHNSEGW